MMPLNSRNCLASPPGRGQVLLAQSHTPLFAGTVVRTARVRRVLRGSTWRKRLCPEDRRHLCVTLGRSLSLSELHFLHYWNWGSNRLWLRLPVLDNVLSSPSTLLPLHPASQPPEPAAGCADTQLNICSLSLGGYVQVCEITDIYSDPLIRYRTPI